MDVTVWLYLINASLLICHEIDSAYWKEWELFNIPGGIEGFLFIHMPLMFLALFGAIEVYKQGFFGYIFSLVLGGVGIFAFLIHMLFILKGKKEFKTPASIGLLLMIFFFSLLQVFYTIF
ncbi:MAG: DUF6713 family protein [Candidatus Margulisiibacteriota bacterium]|nr:hypothetical protein [Candidatus Margulisiibacteriota bacterium]